MSQNTIFQGGRHNCKNPKHETTWQMDKIDSDPLGTKKPFRVISKLKVGYFLWL